jgi:putative tryptophan/tyrosine transport system substrate-binding protein
VRRVGVVSAIPAQESPGFAAFRNNLGELGYVEGQNIAIEYRWSDKAERQSALAVELTGLKIDVIVTDDTSAAFVAELATKDIPIVVAEFNEESVPFGLVDTLKRPGGNVTGMGNFARELQGKRLELLQQIFPGLTRVALLVGEHTRSDGLSWLVEAYQGARRLGVSATMVGAYGDIEDVFQRIVEVYNANGIDVPVVPQFFRIKTKIAELGLKYRLPIVSGLTGFAQAGGLIQYGTSMIDNWRQSAVYVDKILKGEKPADLPVSQPTKFYLVINLKTAEALGLSVPPLLLATANEVIE